MKAEHEKRVVGTVFRKLNHCLEIKKQFDPTFSLSAFSACFVLLSVTNTTLSFEKVGARGVFNDEKLAATDSLLIADPKVFRSCLRFAIERS